MKKLLLLLALVVFPTAASAQCTGVFPTGTVCGNLGASPNVPTAYTLPVITSAQLDAICSTNNDFLIRITGTWQCGSFGTGLTLTGSVLSTVTQQASGIINIKLPPYNAACDGSTDDTAAIAAAVTAAGMTAANTTNGTQELFVPGGSGLCVITSTITLRNAWAGETGPLAVMRCSNSGFVWKGTNNTGPMFVLGDITNTNLDPGFKIDNCYFRGNGSTRPSTILLLANNANSVISNSTFYNAYNAIKCQVQCLLTTISNNFFNQAFASSTGDCITMAVNNGSYINRNNFYWCGQWDYNGPADATVLLQNNYFESNVASQLGSAHISGDGDTFDANTFEDGGTAAGTSFVSVYCDACYQVTFHDDYFVGGSGASGPNFFYKVALAAGPVSWVNEKFGGAPGTYVVDYLSSTPSTWFGGMNACNSSNLITGAGASYVNTVSACGQITAPFYLAATSAQNPFGVSDAGAITASAITASSVAASSPTAGIGYATGSGGTVTQLTSKSTGATLNTINGQITTNNAALGAQAVVSFTLTDSAIGAGDTIVLNHVSGGTIGLYYFNGVCAAGSATITIVNNSTGSLSDALVLKFSVIKGSNN